MSVFDGFEKPPCARTLGWELLEADGETGAVTVRMEGGAAFCNPSGHIQGGFIAAMLDDTLGPTVLVKTGGSHYCATVNLNVSFLAPARPGSFTGHGRLIHLGRSIAFLEGELLDHEGQRVATATASARVVPMSGLARVEG